MRRTWVRVLLSAIVAVTGLMAVVFANAEQWTVLSPGIAVPPPPQPPAPGDLRAVLVPTTVEYEWIFRVPVISHEHQRIAVTMPAVTTHSRRFNYDIPTLRDRRVKLWDFPEFSCKYPDLLLPNECRTVWHPVYVDLPVLATAHDHADVEVLRLDSVESSIAVDIPRCTWVEKRFRFSLPAYAPPDTVARVRLSLDHQRATVTSATDDAIAGIDSQIAALQSRGEDPSKLVSSEGGELDLVAQRQALLDERAQEIERLSAMDAELSRLSTQAPAQR